ncbi:MAG TPA: HAD family hydrolase [Bryobacteraceae bacterium]|nr:HAD family hydrolase [Bryobacteraceae bacterium]
MRQHLLIDADDTLWENNIYFEKAFDDFVAFLAHSSLSASEIRSILDEIELANIKTHGYGAENFARNLCQWYDRLVEREIQPGDAQRIMSLAARIMGQPIEAIEGVPATLEYLSMRHDLILFTKGQEEEQKLKVDRSGLGIYFGHTAVVKEKDAGAYSALVRERRLDRERTWMIGNSPKSDINPALAAGLNAVYVPHDRTWHLERTEIAAGPGKLLRVDRFSDLRHHF